eukprot:TRINITY_DN6742_c1_g3_i1.p1 TRINITY_DN6742_c1_g3~~TRINITY_DN6742_c1_g3_i1.p1  ORF type:complete len:384 (-),score=58.53 TRINITY_DN6742_c1_g3_i1:377-1528(-)
MFKLRDINSLPAARNWLQRAEDGLNTAYGANLERVAQIKGDTSAEQALYVRLWLLKGALAFYSGNRETAAGLLMEAEERLRPLQVPDDQLATMMSMGFREREARFALRATRNDPDRAVEWVLRHRQERAEKRHRQRQDEQVARMNALRQIQRMGFNPALAAQALRQTDNNVLRALDLLTEHGDRIPAAPSVDAPWLGEQAERTRRRSRDAGDRKEEGEEEEEEEEEEDAFQEVVEDVSHDSAEAFLDLTLNEEAQAIRELLAACVGDIPRSTQIVFPTHNRSTSRSPSGRVVAQHLKEFLIFLASGEALNESTIGRPHCVEFVDIAPHDDSTKKTEEHHVPVFIRLHISTGHQSIVEGQSSTSETVQAQLGATARRIDRNGKP